jgi:hypothetical protein
MSRFTGSGWARPSRPVSALGAVVAIGLVGCVALFFVSPGLAVGAFVVLWVLAALGIAAFHIWNATSPTGVPYTTVGFEGGETPTRSDQASRLRELERLRADGLVTDVEYNRKRADILNEDW